jgi:hypothetical protein
VSYRKASPARRVALRVPKRQTKECLAALRQEINALRNAPGNENDRVQTLAALQKTGDGLPTSEQARIVHRLLERVDYDGVPGKLTIILRQADAGHPIELSA